MAVEIDGKDYAVQFIVQRTEQEGGTWKGDEVFADPQSAKQRAMMLLGSGAGVASVRIVRTVFYGWKENGRPKFQDGIGEQ